MLITPVTNETIPVEATRSELTHYFKGHKGRDVIAICKEHLSKLEVLIRTVENEYKK